MAKYFVDGQDLTDIADAIRGKTGRSANMEFPDEFVSEIGSISSGGITPTGTKQITANGTNIDVAQYEKADVAVPASAVDSGTKSITANGNNQDVVGYATVNVNVPNSYSAADEGKVVSNGALVAQSSDTVTQNDTYDTTLINSLTVNVSGGGSSGATVVSSGTFTGTGQQTVAVNVGTRIPITNFILLFWVDDPDDVPYNSSYKWVAGEVIACKDLVQYAYVSHHYTGYDLYEPTYNKHWDVDNSGTITTLYPQFVHTSYFNIRNNSGGGSNSNQVPQILKYSDRIEIAWGRLNTAYSFISGVTYKYKLLYFGSDPTNEYISV